MLFFCNLVYALATWDMRVLANSSNASTRLVLANQSHYMDESTSTAKALVGMTDRLKPFHFFVLLSLTGYGLHCLFNCLDHILNNLLRITEDHHSFIHVEEFVIKTGITSSH